MTKFTLKSIVSKHLRAFGTTIDQYDKTNKFEYEEAQTLAEENQVHDPDWEYDAVPADDGSGKYIVEIRDEEGILVGTL